MGFSCKISLPIHGPLKPPLSSGMSINSTSHGLAASEGPAQSVSPWRPFGNKKPCYGKESPHRISNNSYVHISIYLYIYLSIYLSIYPSIHPSIYLSIYLYIYIQIHMHVDRNRHVQSVFLFLPPKKGIFPLARRHDGWRWWAKRRGMAEDREFGDLRALVQMGNHGNNG